MDRYDEPIDKTLWRCQNDRKNEMFYCENIDNEL